MKKKIQVLRRINRFPVIGDNACAADYRTGIVAELENITTVGLNRYWYDKKGNVCHENISQIPISDFMNAKVTNDQKEFLRSIREQVRNSFAIREEVASLLL